jgi:hypothetical protein
MRASLLYAAVVLLCLFAVTLALSWPPQSIQPGLVYGQF